MTDISKIVEAARILNLQNIAHGYIELEEKPELSNLDYLYWVLSQEIEMRQEAAMAKREKESKLPYLHLAVPFAAVYLTAGRSLGAGVGEAVLLNELAEVLVRFFDCHCVFLLAFVTTSKPEKNEKVQNEKQKTAATRNNSMWLLLFCRLSVSTECYSV